MEPAPSSPSATQPQGAAGDPKALRQLAESARRAAQESDDSYVTVSMAAYLVEQYPGRTCSELAKLANKSRASLARRLPEAESSKRHYVFRGEPRRCEVTDRITLTWWPKAAHR